MKELYTIKGIKNDHDRYIQLGNADRPVIQTRTGYRADRVIVFKDKEQAYEFLVNFINDRQRLDIKWNVVEYRPARYSDTLVGMIKNEEGVEWPGEVSVDYNGNIRKKTYIRRYANLNNCEVSFYARSGYNY